MDVRLRRIARWGVDVAVLALALVLAYFVRFDGVPPSAFREQLLVVGPSIVALKVLGLHLTSAAQRSWRFVSLQDAVSLVLAMTAASTALVVVRFVASNLPASSWVGIWVVPRGVLAIDFVLAVTGLTVARALRRLLAERREADERRSTMARRPTKTILIGAGEAGGLVLRELRRRPDLGIDPVGLLDDDPNKRGQLVQGVRVYGRVGELAAVARYTEAEQALVTIANAPGTTIRRISELCDEAGLPTRIIPGLYEIVDGQVNLSRIRPVEITDLLRRQPVEIDESEISVAVHDESVLVTGAGGSIGSELCRQIARFGPRRLVVAERAESNLWAIHEELSSTYSDIEIVPALLDVTDGEAVAAILRAHAPSFILHAAAHKHVPITEVNVAATVMNNVFGTRTLVDSATAANVDHFVLVSTDKAVNPVSVMGATKRLAERYVQDVAARSGRRYMAVRFGNVLGSNGSVVPIFQRQIEAGGPITITHRDMRRYFMTIPEASLLVLQSAAIGEGGEIFTLEMGKPVRILDLAHDLIRLSGLRVGDDIEIREIGPRPGEKLTEELLLDDEILDRTSHPKILVSHTGDPTWPTVEADLARLHGAVLAGSEEGLRRILEELLPDYRPEAALTRREDSVQGVTPEGAVTVGISPDVEVATQI